MTNTDAIKNKLQKRKAAISFRSHLFSHIGDSPRPKQVWRTSVVPAGLVASLVPDQSHTDIVPPGYNQDDILVDMKYITAYSGLSDKYFYVLIKRKVFPRPIKLGRASRWKMSEFKQWIEQRAAAR